jgi:hypothetical protein
MKGIPIGVVGFLGIFAPGALLLADGLLLAHLLHQLPGGVQGLNVFDKGWLTFALLLLSFTLGMCLRMIPPDLAEGVLRRKETSRFLWALKRYTAQETKSWWEHTLPRGIRSLSQAHVGPWSDEADASKALRLAEEAVMAAKAVANPANKQAPPPGEAIDQATRAASTCAKELKRKENQKKLADDVELALARLEKLVVRVRADTKKLPEPRPDAKDVVRNALGAAKEAAAAARAAAKTAGHRRVRLFHIAKRRVIEASESLGREVLMAESYSRFVSGMLWCFAAGGLACTAACWYLAFRPSSSALAIASLLSVNLFLFLFPALRIGEIRRYEAELVMQSFILVERARRKRRSSG